MNVLNSYQIGKPLQVLGCILNTNREHRVTYLENLWHFVTEQRKPEKEISNVSDHKFSVDQQSSL